MTNSSITIKIPEDQKIDNNTSITFKSFMNWLLNDPQWGQNYDTLLNREAIVNRMLVAESELLIDYISWDLLCQIIKNPSRKYDIKYGTQILFFANHILHNSIKE